MKQTITSKDTSIKQVSAVYTNYKFEPYSFILDIGCGKYYQDTIDRMSKENIVASGYDPYNQTKEINDLSLSIFDNKNPDYIVCSNVLNVIKEDECIEDLLKMICSYSDKNTKIIFSVYRGDSSSIGKETTKGYQRNQKPREYIDLLSKYFEVSKIKGNFIECSNINYERRVA